MTHTYEPAAPVPMSLYSRLAAAEQKLADANARAQELEAAYDNDRRRADYHQGAADALRKKLADANALLRGQLVKRECAEQALAAANDLLRCCRAYPVPISVIVRIDAHLAGQPAAPSRTEAERAHIEHCYPVCHGDCEWSAAPSRAPFPARSIPGRPELTEEFPDDATPSRTEAEPFCQACMSMTERGHTDECIRRRASVRRETGRI